jgi:hypothetical protein
MQTASLHPSSRADCPCCSMGSPRGRRPLLPSFYRPAFRAQQPTIPEGCSLRAMDFSIAMSLHCFGRSQSGMSSDVRCPGRQLMAATETAAHRKNSGLSCRVSASSRHWLPLIDSLTTIRRGYSNSCKCSLHVEIPPHRDANHWESGVGDCIGSLELVETML